MVEGGGVGGGVGGGRSGLGRELLYAAMLREIERCCAASPGESRAAVRAAGQLAVASAAGTGAEGAGEAAAAEELLSGSWDAWHPLLDSLYALCSDSGGSFSELRISLPPLFAALKARGLRHNILPHLLCACYHRWENPAAQPSAASQTSQATLPLTEQPCNLTLTMQPRCSPATSLQPYVPEVATLCISGGRAAAHPCR